MMTTRRLTTCVRRAINYGFNQSILDNVLEGVGYLPQAYISPPSSASRLSAYFVYDRVRRCWMKPAGRTATETSRQDGEPLSLLLQLRGRYLKDAEVAKKATRRPCELGIDVKLEISNGPRSSSGCAADFPADFFTLGWSTATGDADHLGRSSAPIASAGGLELARVPESEFDEIVAAAGRHGSGERAGCMQRSISWRDAVIVPVYNSKETILTSSKLTGFAQRDRLLSLVGKPS